MISVVNGVEPDFNTTSQYIVNVDDFFLKTLQNETAGVYLYTCNGVEFRYMEFGVSSFVVGTLRLMLIVKFVGVLEPVR